MLSDILKAATIGDILGILTSVAGAIIAVTLILNTTKARQEKKMQPFVMQIKELKKEFAENMENMKSEYTLKTNENKVRLLRTELLVTINTQPSKAQIIETLYDEYKKVGGNSYIDQVMKEWRNDFEQGILKERIVH